MICRVDFECTMFIALMYLLFDSLVKVVKGSHLK